jgi:ATP-dependent Lon protease
MNKLKEVFAEMAVLKNPERTKFFADLSLPSYMRDWLVMKFSDDDGIIDYDGVMRYIKQYIPSREDYEQYKFHMVNGESVRFLARLRVGVDIKTGKTTFELPDFGGTKTGAGGEVSNDVVSRWQDTLLRESENWGIIDLVWEQDFSKKPPRGYVKMIGYQPFCPYSVDLDYYREARQNFSTEEWIDIIIAAADYNPNGYDTEAQKMFFLRRLLPFVQNNLNIIELAPLGTGKSYIFDNISKYGWLVAAGTQSRASLFYDNNRRTPGIIAQFDFVAFDEIQTMKFDKPDEVQTALKGYMQTGKVKGFDSETVSGAGIVVLGNVDRFNLNENLVEHINPVFREATLDRFHGFIPGWEIPRFHQGLIADGWGLNTQYFSEVLHKLREEALYTNVVLSCVDLPKKADKRDVDAITRLCTAFVKLIFPHWTDRSDVNRDEFVEYCLEPAKTMRQIIRTQLAFVKPKEFANTVVADVVFREG